MVVILVATVYFLAFAGPLGAGVGLLSVGLTRMARSGNGSPAEGRLLTAAGGAVVVATVAAATVAILRIFAVGLLPF